MIVGIAMFVTMALPAGAYFPISPITPIYVIGTPLYVSTAGSNTGTGEKSNPVKTISKAVEIAKAGADLSYVIYVEEGDYNSETFPLDLSGKTISIYGGYYNHFADRDISNHQTSIKGGSSNTIEITDISSTISGLKIHDQFSGSGVIVVNTTDGNFTTKRFVSVSEVEIENCVTVVGGVLVNAENGDGIKVYDNFIHDVDTYGAGIYIIGAISTGEIHNNFLYNNAGNNAGFCNISGENSVIYNNIITKGSKAGIYLRNNSKVYNNTIVNNKDGIVVPTGISGAEFKNNVIANNSNHAVDLQGGAGHDYNVYYANGSLGLTMASHESDCNPMLANINSLNENDYALRTGSMCIDKGAEIAQVTNDYFGTERPRDGNADATYATDPGAIEADGDLAAMPQVQSATASPNIFSPDADGVNDTTTISYDLNLTSNVKVEIYDGSTLIRTVSSEVEGSGTHTTVWDGRDDSSNVVAEKTYQFKVYAENSEGYAAQTGDVKVDLSANQTGCAGFPDVPISDPICPAIQYVKDQGIFAGYPDGTFRPNDVINRAETTKVVLLGFNTSLLPDDGTDLGFSDVTVNSWYMTYLRTGQHEGIIAGYPDGTFKPGQQVNKVEMLKIFLETSTIDLSTIVPPYTLYPDTPNDAWYAKYVQVSKDHALVDTAQDGNFYPGEGMKRGNVAELFYRFHQAGL